MIKAVTKHGPLNDPVREIIGNSPAIKEIIDKIIATSRTQFDYKKVEDQVVRTFADFHYMLQTCFGMGGDLHFNSKTYMNFFGALAVKCHDIENNLEDGGVRDDKQIRAQIMSMFARIFGLPVASRMAIGLAMDFDYDMFWGTGDVESNLKNVRRVIRTYVRFENDRVKPTSKIFGKTIECDAVQIPIYAPDEVENIDDFRPHLQYRFTIGDSDLLEAVGRAHASDTQLEVIISGKKYLGVALRGEMEDAILSSGRKCYYFAIYDPKQKDPSKGLVCTYRIQDNQPSVHSVLDARENIDPIFVPERRIIRRMYRGDEQSSMNILALAALSMN